MTTSPCPTPNLTTPTIVFTNGCFDLFHAGHVDFLRRCKALGDRLIVGINSDASIRALKGPSRPIVPETERLQIVAACRFVDEAHLFDESTPCELIHQLHPDVIVKGPGYSESNMPESLIVHSYGGRIVLLDGPPISTTKIIERILFPERLRRGGTLVDEVVSVISDPAQSSNKTVVNLTAIRQIRHDKGSKSV